jgi:hypothetical protein
LTKPCPQSGIKELSKLAKRPQTPQKPAFAAGDRGIRPDEDLSLSGTRLRSHSKDQGTTELKEQRHRKYK